MDGDRVAVRIGRGGQRAIEVTNYQIDLDMLELADMWSLSIPFDRDTFEACECDNPITIELNDRPILSGLVDDRKWNRDKNGSMIELSGRDKGGRLVDSAAPMIDLTGIGILDLARRMATAVGSFSLFPSIELQNATNRRLMGGGKRARTAGEPPIRTNVDRNDRRVRPGQTRAQVLEDWLEEAGLLGWSSADGSAFIVGKPNYAQDPQFHFLVPSSSSAAVPGGVVLNVEFSDSVGERFARIIALGSGTGNARNFGENVQRRGVALQGSAPDGTGAAFFAPKDMILCDDNVSSQAVAKARAAREMALRESGGRTMTIMVDGHSQRIGNEMRRTNYTPDIVVRIDLEDLRGLAPLDWLVTRCQFSGSKNGRTTRMSVVPKGTDLRMTSG